MAGFGDLWVLNALGESGRLPSHNGTPFGLRADVRIRQNLVLSVENASFFEFLLFGLQDLPLPRGFLFFAWRQP